MRVAVVALVLAAGCSASSGTASVVAGTTPPAPSTSDRATADPVATATVVAATAQPVTPSPEPSATPAPTLTASTHVTSVTDGDSGSTVVLRVGQRLDVRLSEGTWDLPSADSARLRRIEADGGYPTDRPAHAVFEAMTTGRSDVTAQSDAACFHTEPRCLMPTREWRVHVVIR